MHWGKGPALRTKNCALEFLKRWKGELFGSYRNEGERVRKSRGEVGSVLGKVSDSYKKGKNKPGLMEWWEHENKRLMWNFKAMSVRWEGRRPSLELKWVEGQVDQRGIVEPCERMPEGKKRSEDWGDFWESTEGVWGKRMGFKGIEKTQWVTGEEEELTEPGESRGQ